MSSEVGRTPRVTTGFQVRYQGDDDAFTTFQTFQPVDGNHYKVKSFTPVVFLPAPGYRIDTSTPETPLVIRREDGASFYLNDSISQAFVRVADRWENPLVPDKEIA